LGNKLTKGVHGDILFVGNKNQLQQDWLRSDVKIIAGLNSTRNKINRYIAKSDIPIAGHRIIFLKNDWNNMITNGTTAEIDNLNLISFSSFKLDFTTDDDLIFKDYAADFQKQSNPKKQFFDFAYCLTAHKAQGATYDAAGLIIDESNYFREYKNHWLYTAITRYTGRYNVAVLQ
jgi:exodeoxyribonuclease-5